MRRVRRRLPDRRADQQADQQRADPPARGAAPGRHGLPVLRRRLRAHVQRRRRAQGDRLRRRPPAARLAQPALRQGPLRLGLLLLPAAAHDAADPPRVELPEGPASADVRGEEDARAASRRKPGGLVDYDEVCRTSARPRGRRRSISPPAGSSRSTRSSGPGAIAGFGSAKCSNEEAYLFQKLIRAGFGTNNIDHCTRLCHASSVAALFEGVGSGAVSTTYGDIVNADVAILAGTNTTANHPVASSFFKQARRRGTKLIVVDPRRERIADHADVYCQIKPGTDVAFYNGVMHEVIKLGLVDREFIAERTSNYGALAKLLEEYTPERAEQITGIDADTIRLVARMWGEAGAGVIYWGMGISQHTTGTDNARCLIAMCSITGNVGKQGTGLHPLRGQNNVQGASDAGLIPMFYPDYQPVDAEGVRERFEEAWGRELDPKRGLTVTEIVASALHGGVRGMYMMGENPFLSDPNINKVRKALSALDFLVVQDIFLTETAEFADVILPATTFIEKDGTYTNTDRRVQIGPQGARPARRGPRRTGRSSRTSPTASGCRWTTRTRREIFDELVSVMPNYARPELRQPRLDRQALSEPRPGPQRRHGRALRRALRHRRRPRAPRARGVAAGQGAAVATSTRSSSTRAACSSTGTPGR